MGKMPLSNPKVKPILPPTRKPERARPALIPICLNSSPVAAYFMAVVITPLGAGKILVDKRPVLTDTSHNMTNKIGTIQGTNF